MCVCVCVCVCVRACVRACVCLCVCVGGWAGQQIGEKAAIQTSNHSGTNVGRYTERQHGRQPIIHAMYLTERKTPRQLDVQSGKKRLIIIITIG